MLNCIFFSRFNKILSISRNNFSSSVSNRLFFSLCPFALNFVLRTIMFPLLFGVWMHIFYSGFAIMMILNILLKDCFEICNENPSGDNEQCPEM